MGWQHGKLRRADTPCKHGDCSWEGHGSADGHCKGITTVGVASHPARQNYDL